MGNGDSKEEDENSHNDNSSTGTVVSEESNGFHIVEIHAPTAGVGLTMLVIAAAVAAAIWWFWKKRRRRWGKKQHQKLYPFAQGDSNQPWGRPFAANAAANDPNWFPLMDRLGTPQLMLRPDFRNPWSPTVLAPERFQEIHEPMVRRPLVFPPQQHGRGLPPVAAQPPVQPAAEPADNVVDPQPVAAVNPNAARVAAAVAGH